MKRVLTALLAVSALAAAVPATASAQSWNGRNNGAWMSIDARQAMLDRRIDMGIRNGTLTRREANQLRREFRDIARLESRYRSGGLQGWERADLDRRFDTLSARIRVESRDNDRRYGYGYGDGRYNPYRY